MTIIRHEVRRNPHFPKRPPEEEKCIRDTETTIENRPGLGALIGTGRLHGNYERQQHATATTNRRGHTRQASSVSNDQISPKRATSAPPEEEKSTRDTETETAIENRPGLGTARWHGLSARRLRKPNRNTKQPQQIGAWAHSTSIFHLQRPNFPQTRQEEDRSKATKRTTTTTGARSMRTTRT